MNKKALDEKYFYQIDENSVVHLFRGEDDCQQYLTNPLISAIFKIEQLEKHVLELQKDKGSLIDEVNKLEDECRECIEHKTKEKLIEAMEIIRELLRCYKYVTKFSKYADKNPIAKAEAFLKE